MAVCLATTTGDSVDDDDVVELVREDDEVCLLDRAIITSYSPLAFHLQLNARSSFRGWLESRLNSPAADLYLARCSKGRSCDRCILASQITCAESQSPLCLACIQRSELYCSIFFRNPIPCRNWTDIQTREFETRVEYFVELVGGKGMDVGPAASSAHVGTATTSVPLKSSLKEGLSRLRDRTKTLSFRKQPPISEEPSLVAQMEEEYHRAVSDRAIDRRLLKTYPHPAGPPVRLDMTRRLQQLEEEDNNSGSGSVTHHSNELYGPPGPRPPLGVSSWSLGKKPNPDHDRTGRACSTPATHAGGESRVERSGGTRERSRTTLAEELGLLADARRSSRGIYSRGRDSDSSFDNLVQRSRTFQQASVGPKVAQPIRRAESPPPLVDQFENIGRRSNTSQVRE